jgi:glyoxylase-like metal-dependent hydrolase (beta-lactamase superfamily II)
VAELAPGVFALSSLLDLARPLSWVDPGETGHDPCTCYLLLGGGAAHLVDTGPRAVGEPLARQLAELITPRTPLDVTLTRVEPDSLGNLDVIADRFRVVRVSSQSNVIPFDYLGPLSARYPGTAINNGVLPGDVVEWAGGRRLVAIEPAVRTLPTMWYLDEPTGTLLTSDFFGDVHVDADWTPRTPDVERARRHLLAKFDWLAMADTSAAVARLDRIAAMPGLRAVAPAHGLWTIGETAVGELLSRTRRALAEPVHMSRP